MRSQQNATQGAYVRSERLILASPMEALPKTWLYVYKAWQLTSFVTFNATALFNNEIMLSLIGRPKTRRHVHSNERKQEKVSVREVEYLQNV